MNSALFAYLVSVGVPAAIALAICLAIAALVAGCAKESTIEVSLDHLRVGRPQAAEASPAKATASQTTINVGSPPGGSVESVPQK